MMVYATTFGDMAQSLSLQRRGAELKTEMDRLNKELVTGQVSDIKSVLAGNVSYLSELENDIRALDGYSVVTTEAAHFTDAMQTALEYIQTSSTNYSQDLIAVAQNAVEPVLDQLAVDARSELETVVNALNTTVGGRAIFSGAATDQPAIADVENILTNLSVAVSGAGSVDEIFAAADAWLDDPAGYAAAVYSGSATPLASFRVADGETVSVRHTADDIALREVVKGLALASLADSGLLASTDGKRSLMNRLGTELLGAQAELTALRADVGAAQDRIDQLTSRNAAEALSLEYAKGALLEADPYETATKLEEVQFQLESLYVVTARLADLSLVNFIR